MSGNKQFFKNKSTRIRSFVLILVFSSVTVLLTGAGSRNFEVTKNLDIFSTLFRELVVNYIDDFNISEAMKTGIDEMLESLDPYTTFITESQIEDVRMMTTGQYGGIGARIQSRDNRIMITEPYEGFPAHNAGLLPGDFIIEINNQSLQGRGADEVRALLQGQPGTTLNLLIERDGKEWNESIERDVIRVANIPYYGMLDETTAYIKLTGFTRRAGREVRDAFLEMKKEHPVESLVLDLRGNGGGLLHEAVNIVNLFVEKEKLVVHTRGRLEDRTTVHRTLNEPIDTEIPLVVLVDRASASASEIVAGAIQDYDRGVILGHRTFGKGLVQNVLPLSYNTQLKVTVAEYFIPSGRGIQAINYAERHADGSVSKIPDSLKVAHKTMGGRIVYDGGGIDPDVEVGLPQKGAITQALQRNLMFFDFANFFYKNHESINEPREFVITDQIYDDFIAFISANDFSYETESERMLRRLQSAAESEQYYSALSAEVEALRNIISQEKAGDTETFRAEIEHLLRQEIVSRYYYREGRAIVSLDDDPEVEKAIGLLTDRERYSLILATVN